MNAKAEVVNVFQLTEVTDAPNEVIEPYERHSQHTGFGSHGLRVANIERRKRHDMVHIQRVYLDAVLLKLRLKRTLGGK